MSCRSCGGHGDHPYIPEWLSAEMAHWEAAHPGAMICGTSMGLEWVACGDCPAGDARREAEETLDLSTEF